MPTTLATSFVAEGDQATRLLLLEQRVDLLSSQVQRSLQGIWDKEEVTRLGVTPHVPNIAIAPGGVIPPLTIPDRSITGTKLVLDTISSLELADGSVLATKIADSAVTTAKILDDAVTALKLANLAVTEAKIAANAITTTKIADDAITTPKLVANSITSAKIAAGQIQAGHIVSHTITANEIAALTITGGEIAANAIVASKIAAGEIAVTHLASVWLYTKDFELSTSGKLHSGQTAYNTGTGFWMEYNGGTPRFSLGNSSGNKLTWDGSTLSITGSITLTNTIAAGSVTGLAATATNSDYTAITGTKPPANADVTLTAINGGLSITGGGLILASGGAAIRSGSGVTYGSTTGFWLGDDGGTHKFRIGNPAGNKLTWDGSVLSITGAITLTNTIAAGSVTGLAATATSSDYSVITGTKPPANADVTLTAIVGGLSITGGGLILASGGAAIRSGSSVTYSANTGFWLGDDSGTHKFRIGNPAGNKLTWDGSVLSITGAITLTNTIAAGSVTGLAATATSSDYSAITGTKPPSNADVTLTAIEGGLSLTGGGLILTSGGAAIRSGSSVTYSTTTGFWLGDDGGTHKFRIGNPSGNKLQWNGSSLEVTGNFTGSSFITIGTAADKITLNGLGFLHVGDWLTSGGYEVQLEGGDTGNSLEFWSDTYGNTIAMAGRTSGEHAYIGVKQSTSGIGVYIEADATGTGLVGLVLGSDTNLYRNAANVLKTDDQFQALKLVGNGSGFNPTNTGVQSAALSVNGSYGGAITLIDSTGYIALWAESTGADFKIGTGTSASVTERLKINSSGLSIPSGTGLYVAGTKVVGGQQSAIASFSIPVFTGTGNYATDTTPLTTAVNDNASKINSILAALRTHGLIAT